MSFVRGGYHPYPIRATRRNESLAGAASAAWVPTLHTTDRQPGTIATPHTATRARASGGTADFHGRRELVVTGEATKSGAFYKSGTFYNVPNAHLDCCCDLSGLPVCRAAASQNLVCSSGRGSSGYVAPFHFSF